MCVYLCVFKFVCVLIGVLVEFCAHVWRFFGVQKTDEHKQLRHKNSKHNKYVKMERNREQHTHKHTYKHFHNIKCRKRHLKKLSKRK